MMKRVAASCSDKRRRRYLRVSIEGMIDTSRMMRGKRNLWTCRQMRALNSHQMRAVVRLWEKMRKRPKTMRMAIHQARALKWLLSIVWWTTVWSPASNRLSTMDLKTKRNLRLVQYSCSRQLSCISWCTVTLWVLGALIQIMMIANSIWQLQRHLFSLRWVFLHPVSV